MVAWRYEISFLLLKKIYHLRLSNPDLRIKQARWKTKTMPSEIGSDFDKRRISQAKTQ